MADAIDAATAAASKRINLANLPSSPNFTIPPITPLNIPAALAGAKSLDDLKAKLPIQKDPQLIKLETEVKALEIKAEAERKLLELEEGALDAVKKQLIGLVLRTINFPPKLPLINPKILLALALAEKTQLLIQLKQKLSRANLKKASEVYTYPLTPPTLNALAVRPTLPPLPKIPSVPTLPTVPRLPSLPSVPSIPSLPSRPRLP